MQDLTIIGLGISAQTLIDKLKAEGFSQSLTAIDKDEFYFSRPGLISAPADISKRIELSSWARERGINFINDKVERVNPKRKKVYLKNSEIIEYKKLIIATGLKSKKHPAKGDHREGFFYLSALNPFKLKDLVRISKEAVVDVSTFLGIKLAVSLNNLGLEVRVTCRNLDFLSVYKEKLLNYFDHSQIAINFNTEIDEAVGESTVKAVKVNPLKVFSSQMLFLDSGFSPAADFFEEEVYVSDCFFSNYEDLYFLADAGNSASEGESFFINNYSDCCQQALIFSEFLLKGRRPDFSRTALNEDDIEKAVNACFKDIKKNDSFDSVGENIEEVRNG
ncbi:MAG: FAD-dependent oxidoreductase [Candidatus Omnitrophica bacterium]|nr:FAD-dependent oxidoreductase [Candidatus Omnitrophota bacterium]